VRRRNLGPLIGSVLLAAAPIAVLIATRPSGRPPMWSADQVVRTTCWGLACACTAWLAITMLSCVVAFVRVDAAAALRVAGGAPPIVRRVVQTLFAGAVAVAPMTSDTAPPPIRLHAGADGRLVDGRTRSSATTTSTTTSTTNTTMPSKTPKSFPQPELVPPVRVAHPQARRVAAAPAHAHVVRTGDNLWSIARAEIVRTTGDARPSDAVIAEYWQRVIALNRATLRSGNPSLIFPGEIVALPTS